MNLTIRLFLLVLLSLPVFTNAQNWANRIGSTNTATSVDKIRALNQEQFLTLGKFAASSLLLGNTTIPGRGQEDGYLAITNLNGTYEWAIGFGGTGKDQGIDVASNQNGGFSVIGNFNSNALKIGNITLNNSGETDVFIAHFDASRNLLWARAIGGPDVEEAAAVVVDQTGNTYVAGNVYNKLTLQLIKVFIRKLDPSGNMLWEKNGTIQSGFLAGTALALDDQQELFYAGSVSGTAQFDQTSISSDQDYSAFLIKYQSDGKTLITKTFDDLEKFNDLQFKNQRLYGAAQQFNWSIGWGWPLADSEIHTLCFSNNLDILWHKTAGGVHPAQSLDIARSISIDERENVYVAGYFFSDTLRFAGQAHANLFHIHYYYPQIFLLKYNKDGKEEWIKTFGDQLTDEATGIIAFKNDQILLAGNFESAILNLEQKTLVNDNAIDSMYVHLRPKRFFRKSMGYLAYFPNISNNVSKNPITQIVSIWPNPANHTIHIQLSQSGEKQIRVLVTSLDGTIHRSVVYNASGRILQEDISHLPPGIYVVQVHLGDHISSKTIIKHSH